ncbi:hypothetical protein AAG596_00480 [Citromicrobium bathyomarinum]
MDRKVWERLLRFESRDYLARFYRKKHGRDLNAQRAREIGACFSQGRDYFSAASQASETVKPLVIYYGVASLCRGATMLRNKDKREESLTPGHGLATVGWADTLSGGIENVLQLQVEATKGTFTEFVEALGNGQSYTWLSADLRTGGFQHDYGQPSLLMDGTRVTLWDLLSRERELAAEFEIANDGWGNTDFGRVVALEDRIRIHFSPIKGMDQEAAIASYHFPATATFSIQPDPKVPVLQTVCVEMLAEGEARKALLPMAERQSEQVAWLIRPLPNGDNLIDIHRLLIEAYILGMLCRYFPSKWMALLGSDKGDIARSVILAAIDRIEREFPKLLTDQLPG